VGHPLSQLAAPFPPFVLSIPSPLSQRLALVRQSPSITTSHPQSQRLAEVESRSIAKQDALALLSRRQLTNTRTPSRSIASAISLPREELSYLPTHAMDRHHPSHQGERPLHGHHHASSNPTYPPPFHMSTAQPPTQIPFADPFSRGRDPFLPGPHGRKGSLGPGPQGWPPAQGTFKSLLHKSEISDAPGGPGCRNILRALSMCSCCERNSAATCSHGTRRRLDSGTWSSQAVMRQSDGGVPAVRRCK
jgi:hypothetical protein